MQNSCSLQYHRSCFPDTLYLILLDYSSETGCRRYITLFFNFYRADAMNTDHCQCERGRKYPAVSREYDRQKKEKSLGKILLAVDESPVASIYL